MRAGLYFLCTLLTISQIGLSQSYTSYLTGSANDVIVNGGGGVCLMGGASENNEAMKWFLRRANEGDVVVLRASGSDGYNEYFYSDLGIPINSVETILMHNQDAANEAYVQQKVAEAEAIWFAGGDQWDYISFLRNTPIDSIINANIENRSVVIGGTSAGMAIQGGLYFTAQNGTVTSQQMLQNPFHPNCTLDSASFISNEFLADVITDTHYDNPDRAGRHVAFLARIYSDYQIRAKGIACEEYTSVCIDENGLARVFGSAPEFDDKVYFIQINCEIGEAIPEVLNASTPLTWNYNEEVISVYKVDGTESGSNTFNLNTWDSGQGGDWEFWHVENGQLFQNAGEQPLCIPLSSRETADDEFLLFPNPTKNHINIQLNANKLIDVHIKNSLGQIVESFPNLNQSSFSFSTKEYPSGIYYIVTQTRNSNVNRMFIKVDE